MNAVGAVKFAMFETILNVQRITPRITFRVRFLYTAAGRRVIMGNRETNHAAIRELYRPVHQSFAKLTTTKNLATVLILQRTRNDFGCRSRKFVDENHHFPREQTTFSVGPELLLRHTSP